MRELHELYCHWTAQTLSLRFDRERLWYEFLRAGFSTADLKRVVTYLRKEIRAERRNIGALKLSNLLQLDRFEEESAAFGSSRQPRISTRLSYRRLIRKSPINNATRYSTNSESFASTYVATVRLLKPDVPKLPALTCPQPTKQHDQTRLFLRNTLTPAPRNNVARYKLEVQSEIGEGTTVTMRIPLPKPFGVGLELPGGITSDIRQLASH